MHRSWNTVTVATLLFLGLPFVRGYSSQFLECQLLKNGTVPQLTGCPEGTLYVSAIDAEANFTTVQAAVGSLPETGNATILIGAGEYEELVNVTRIAPLTLLGQLDPETAFLTGSNASSRNLVHIFNTTFVANGIDDAQTAVLVVAPNFNGSLIGAGTDGAPLQPEFGNVDFKAYNINFENRAASFAISQALAIDISYANASFYGCAIASFQDTWYTGRNASTYVVDSIIYGQTDYLFGFGTAWFENVTLASRACGGGIAAWKGNNQTFAPGNRYGAYISNSRIIRSPDANATTNITEQCWLGRPWNDFATSVFLNVFMEDIIQPQGFEPFDSARPTIMNTTYYAEFNSHGPGGNTSARVSDHILAEADVLAMDFTVDGVFLEHPAWIDFEYSST